MDVMCYWWNTAFFFILAVIDQDIYSWIERQISYSWCWHLVSEHCAYVLPIPCRDPCGHKYQPKKTVKPVRSLPALPMKDCEHKRDQVIDCWHDRIGSVCCLRMHVILKGKFTLSSGKAHPHRAILHNKTLLQIVSFAFESPELIITLVISPQCCPFAPVHSICCQSAVNKGTVNIPRQRRI